MSAAEATRNSDRVSPARPGLSTAETAAIGHCALLLIFTSWAFGGQAPWVRQVIALWGAGAPLLFLANCRTADGAGRRRLHAAVRWLWPLLAYDLLVGLSCLNPGFVETVVAGEPSLVLGTPKPWLPSAAQPEVTLRELWQFNVFVLAGFNLALVLRGRRAVRTTLLIVGGNAVALAVFGTFQKLSGAAGLWFGLVPSPNPNFFATFIYHNHWGAFTLLNAAACVGLLTHHLRRAGQGALGRSPVGLGLLAVLLLAVTLPLSASRSCTVLMAVLLLGSLGHGLLRLIRRRREQRESAWRAVAAIILAGALAAMAIAYLGREVIAQRAHLTSEQLAHLAREDTLNSRLVLYRDTWHMAAAKPWFGWGLESYAHVFRIFNTQRAVESWVWIPFYAEAHSDWLQSLAEVGFVGTGLLALLLLLPLRAVRWRQVQSYLPRYLLAGCALVLLYAWVEFPFANPAVMLTFSATFFCAVSYARLDLRAQREDQS